MAEPVAPPGVNHLDSDTFQRLYGPWEPPVPSAVADLLAGAPFPWWVAGGWSLEASDEPVRPHEDIDLGFLARDLPAVREWFDDHHLWEASAGSLRPLLPGDPLTEGCQQLWLRRDAYSPWLMDLVMSPSDGDDWLYKRDHRLRRPLEDVVRRRADGVPLQAPEVTLLFKARLRRAKDAADLGAVLPGLDDDARAWLRAALDLTEPGHPWIDRL